MLLALFAVAACAPRAQLASGPVATAIQAPSGAAVFDWADWDATLARVVDPAAGTVDYASLQADHAALDRTVAALAKVDLAALSLPEREALLINAYNAFTVTLIVEQHPLPASIKDLPDPWGTRRWTVAGQALSLDDIEHGLLRPVFKDPRIHFAVNCASRGCPPLRPRAFRGATLDADLDTAVREALARPTQLSVEGTIVHATRLFDWYGADFTMEGWNHTAPTRQAWIARYAPADVAGRVADGNLAFIGYDWELNAGL